MKKTKYISFTKSVLVLLIILSTTLTFAQKSGRLKPEPAKNHSQFTYLNPGNSVLSTPSYFSNSRKNENKYYPDNKHSKDISRRTSRSDEETNSENYFHIDKSGKTLWDGKHWNSSKFPLKVFIRESTSSYYNSSYKKYIPYAFNVWRRADDRINYRITYNKRDADIIISFVEDLGKQYEDDYLGITEYDVDGDNEIETSTIQISLLKFGTEKISDGEIKATIIHEIGHALGLGHSNNELDIMYPYISPENTAEMNYDELSRGDKEAIKDVISLSNNELYVRK